MEIHLLATQPSVVTVGHEPFIHHAVVVRVRGRQSAQLGVRQVDDAPASYALLTDTAHDLRNVDRVAFRACFAHGEQRVGARHALLGHAARQVQHFAQHGARVRLDFLVG